jgi:SAM-dependent methyltransferase
MLAAAPPARLRFTGENATALAVDLHALAALLGSPFMPDPDLQAPPTDFDARERGSWAGQAADYRQSYALVCAGAVPYLADSVGIRPGSLVLDAGTGTGTAAAAAVARGATVTAVDADPEMVATAAALVPEVDCHVAALPALPFGDRQFDAVLANFVVNHVGQPRAALAELRRVTIPGGRVAVTAWPQPPSPAIALLTRAIRDCGADRPAHQLEPSEEFPRTEAGLRDLLGDAGLRDPACQLINWRLMAEPREWWGIASGASWMRAFRARQGPALLSKVQERFNELSSDYRGEDGRLCLPVAALLAQGKA